MPIQISTVLYVAEYNEKPSSGYLVANAIGYTRLGENTEQVQRYNITAFYPVDDSKPCYLPPKLEEGQILSISNSKISQGSNGELDVSYLYLCAILR
jgi:hypothetical protein